MDPRGTTLGHHATHMLQFNSGTDVAMLNALLHVIIEEEIYDNEYVSQFTEGFENLRRHVKQFSPEEMSKICGIDADTLRLVARKYATAETLNHLLGHGYIPTYPWH